MTVTLPEEVWVSAYPCFECGATTCSTSPTFGTCYLRADLADDPPGSWSATDPIRSRLPRKVKPLTSEECQKLHEADMWCDLDSTFIAIMAARGIEVGE